MKYLILSLIITFSSQTLGIDLEAKSAHLGSDKIDVLKYDIDLKVTDPKEDIKASVTITIKARESFQYFALHINDRGLKILNVITKKLNSFKIKQGKKGKHGLVGKVLKINLDKIIKKNEIFQAKVIYVIKASTFYDNKGFMFDKNYLGSQVLNIRSWPYYTRYWLPSNDHPSDVAIFHYKIRVPKNLNAIANGTLQKGDFLKGEGSNNGQFKNYRYFQNTAIPTYSTNIVIGDLKIYEQDLCYNLSGPVDNKTLDCSLAEKKIRLRYVYPPKIDFSRFKEKILKSSKALIYYSKLFHNYEFSGLGFVTAPHPFNMESVNLITLVSASAAVHEVLHQWFGNSLYFKHWGDFWISEGLTTYFTGHYDEYLSGKNTTCKQKTGQLNHGPHTDPMDIFNSVPYCKGAAAIMALRKHFADLLNPVSERELFELIIKNLYIEFRFKNLDLQDMVYSFRKSLLKISQDTNSPLTLLEIDLAMNEWKSDWFVTL